MPTMSNYSFPAGTERGRASAFDAVREGRSFELVGMTAKSYRFAPWLTQDVIVPGAFDRQVAGALFKLTRTHLTDLRWEIDVVFNKDRLWDIWVVFRAPSGSGLPTYSTERSADGALRVFMRDFMCGGRFVTETVPLNDEPAATLEAAVMLIRDDAADHLARCGLQAIPGRSVTGRMTGSRPAA